MACSHGLGLVCWLAVPNHRQPPAPTLALLAQAPLPPVALARDLFVQHVFSPAHFLDHAAYDCGRLEGAS